MSLEPCTLKECKKTTVVGRGCLISLPPVTLQRTSTNGQQK